MKKTSSIIIVVLFLITFKSIFWSGSKSEQKLIRPPPPQNKPSDKPHVKTSQEVPLKMDHPLEEATTSRLSTNSHKITPTSHRNSMNHKSNASPRAATLSVQEWFNKSASCLKQGSSKKDLLCCVKMIKKTLPLGLAADDGSFLKQIGFSDYFLRLLPEHDVPRFGSCAVVSSAPSLLKYQMGNEIDSHDAVIRINLAPTKEFEKHVGKKTTIRFINSGVAAKMNKNLVGLDSSNVTYFVRDLPLSAKPGSNFSQIWDTGVFHPVRRYVKNRENFPSNVIFLNHPLFAVFAGRDFVTNVLGKKPHYTLSSGSQAFLMALFMCESVTAYELATTDSLSRQFQYYFDKKNVPYSTVHPLDIERKVLATFGSPRKGAYVFTANFASVDCKN
eukprot:m.126566 g.126566  ORF g.126566 m.126566 type:complete len:388 (+) comp37906_c0_seq4:552-1715(+)